MRTPFPNNQIPQSRIDPVSKSIIDYVQASDRTERSGDRAPGTSAYVRNNYISAGTTIIAEQQVQCQGRPGAHLQAEDLVLLRAHPGEGPVRPHRRSRSALALAGNPGYNRSDVYRISHDYTLSPTLLNRFYAGGNNWEQNHGSFATYSGAPQSQGIPTPSTGWKSKGICIPNYPDCNDDFPQVNFSNSEFTAWGVAAPNGSDNIVVEFHDDMTKTTARIRSSGATSTTTPTTTGSDCRTSRGT